MSARAQGAPGGASAAAVPAGGQSGSAAAAGKAPAGPAAAAAASGASFTLKIGSGSGGGSYHPNTLIHIWAHPNPVGMVFDRWTGDLNQVVDRYSPQTVLVMPAANVSLAAAYKRAASCQPETESWNGVEVVTCLPPKHFAAIVLFHPRDGAAKGFFNQVEPRIFVNDAAAAGYALIAIDSADREHRNWQWKPPAAPPNAPVAAPPKPAPPAAAGAPAAGAAPAAADPSGSQGQGNPDVRNVTGFLASLVRRHLLAAGEPLYGLGIGMGGNFAAHLAGQLHLKAVALYFAPGNFGPKYGVPTIWLMAQNDDAGKAGGGGDPRALEEYTKLLGREVPAKFDVNDASPLYPLRFWRIPGLDAADSRAIYQALKAQRFLDPKDYLVLNPQDLAWNRAVPGRYAPFRGAIREQLDVCYAAARFYSDFDSRVIDFFNEHR